MKHNPYLWHNFVSSIIRSQISLFRLVLGNDALIPILPLRFYMLRELVQFGPSFSYKGDEVMWCWKERNWRALAAGGPYRSLAEVDAFWKEYDAYLRAEYDRELDAAHLAHFE